MLSNYEKMVKVADKCAQNGWVARYSYINNAYSVSIDECKNGNDETAEKMEVFTTEKSNQFIYWRSNEIDADYLTKVSA